MEAQEEEGEEGGEEEGERVEGEGVDGEEGGGGRKRRAITLMETSLRERDQVRRISLTSHTTHSHITLTHHTHSDTHITLTHHTHTSQSHHTHTSHSHITVTHHTGTQFSSLYSAIKYLLLFHSLQLSLPS